MCTSPGSYRYRRAPSLALDRGYYDYELFANRTRSGVYFVTRLKDNADFRVLEEHPVCTRGNILCDQTIIFAAPKVQKDCPFPLRRIVSVDPESGQSIVLLINHFEFAASTIGAIYKDRWQIELFFKALKQNLRVKTFVGTTENALYIQIWTALIAILLIKFMQFKAACAWSLSNLVAFLRWNLFTYRDLWDWLDRPDDTLPLEPPPSQQPLPFRNLGQHMVPKMATSS